MIILVLSACETQMPACQYDCSFVGAGEVIDDDDRDNRITSAGPLIIE